MEVGIADKLGSHIQNPPQNGAAEQVVFSKGEEYPISYPEQRIKGQFEQWLIRNELKGIMDIQALGEQEQDEQQKIVYFKEADRQRAVMSANRSAGKYNWMGDFCRAAWFDIPGQSHMVFLLIRRCKPEITQDEAYLAYMNNRKDFESAMWWALGKDMPPLGGAPKASS